MNPCLGIFKTAGGRILPYATTTTNSGANACSSERKRVSFKSAGCKIGRWKSLAVSFNREGVKSHLRPPVLVDGAYPHTGGALHTCAETGNREAAFFFGNRTGFGFDHGIDNHHRVPYPFRLNVDHGKATGKPHLISCQSHTRRGIH